MTKQSHLTTRFSRNERLYESIFMKMHNSGFRRQHAVKARLSKLLHLLGLGLLPICLVSCDQIKEVAGSADSDAGNGVPVYELIISEPFKPPVVVYKEVIQHSPKDGMNDAQREFWDYLEQFNTLPENPSEHAVGIFNAKGVAPTFEYLPPSPNSVFGDVDGLREHRELFVDRYPWAKKLINQYDLEIPISEKRFARSAKGIEYQYNKLMRTLGGCEANDETKRQFVLNFLEGLLVVDYVYARGTSEDREVADDVWRGVFVVNYMIHPFEKELAEDLIIPATRDIGWATISAYPEKMWGLTPSMLTRGFRLYAPVERVKVAKWLLFTDGIPQKANDLESSVHWGLMHNWRMEAGLSEYSIYAAHCTEAVRPADKPWGQVVKNVFRITYGKDFNSEYSKYKRLLDAAYPKIP